MKPFLKSRFFIVLVAAVVLFVAVPTALSAMGLQEPVRNVVNVLTTPLQKVFNYVTDAIDGFSSYFTEFDNLVSENAALKKENAALRDRLYKAEKTENLNAWLEEFLEMKRYHTDFSFTPATVTGGDSGNYMTVFTVDRGSAHGITENMPVVSPDGVIGYVSEVGLTWSKVRTLIESTASVGAYIERTGEMGLVTGSFMLAADGVCEITYLPADSDIRVGDRILTSGYGSIYPRDLVIGYVSTLAPDAYSRTLTATIIPAAALTDLEKVMIITDYDTVTE